MFSIELVYVRKRYEKLLVYSSSLLIKFFFLPMFLYFLSCCCISASIVNEDEWIKHNIMQQINQSYTI